MIPAISDKYLGGREFRRALPLLFLLASVFFLTFLARIIFSPLLPLLEEEMAIPHSAGASLFLCLAAGYVVSILFSPFLTVKIGNKKAISWAMLGSGVMLIVFSLCHTLLGCQILCIAIGLSAGLYLPSGIASIVELTPPSHLSRGMAIHELAPNLGFVLAPLISSLLVFLFGWRIGLVVLGIFCICWGGVYSRYGYDCTRLQQPLNLHLGGKFLCMSLFVRITLLLCLAVSSTIGVYSMLPLLLVNEHGMTLKAANTLVAGSRIGSIFMPLVGGWLGDRFGNGRMLVVVLLLTGLLTLPIGLFDGWRVLVFVILQPLVAVMFFPCCFALFATLGEGEERGMALSLGIPAGFLVGGGFLPLVIGFIGDRFGLADGFVVAGGLMIVVAVLAGGSRELLSRKGN